MANIQILEGKSTLIYGYIELAIIEYVRGSYLVFPECTGGAGF